MEVSGQLYAPAALPPGKSPWYTLVGPRAILGAVVKRKFPSPHRQLNPTFSINVRDHVSHTYE